MNYANILTKFGKLRLFHSASWDHFVRQVGTFINVQCNKNNKKRMKENITKYMQKSIIIGLLLVASMPLAAQQDAFDKFKQQQNDKFDKFKSDQQAEFDAFRKRINEKYAEFMRQKWESFPVHEAEKLVKEKEVPPVIYEPVSTIKPDIETNAIEIAPTSQVVVVPKPQSTPEPIAPVKPKDEPYKRVSIAYFGTIITVGFPINDNLKLRAVEENAIADAWQQLTASRYDIMVSTALNAREANQLCDWAYMKMLQTVTEKQYGKTNEAVLVQAFLMTQSGYRIRLGMDNKKLYMLVASLYDIFDLQYYLIDGTKFYNVSGGKNVRMQITEANYEKEKSLSLQMTQLPLLNSEPTPKRTLTSKKGVTSYVTVNKNMIDFFNIYPQACFNGNQNTRWAAYANTPIEESVKDVLYPPLRKTISGMNEKDAVDIILNWVQTAFEYGLDDKIWGGDRAFFAQETLFYPYSDCEDRAILFSRLIRDLVGLDVVLLSYPGHLAAAVAFNEDVNGDYLMYKNCKYVVCDPTYINAGVGLSMPSLSNTEVQGIALK